MIDKTDFSSPPWEETWDQGKTYPSWNMNYSKMREFQPQDVAPQYMHEDIAIPPTYAPSKKKKSGGADPRFRRVINPDYRSEAEMDADKLEQEDRGEDDKIVSFLKIPNNASFMTPSLKLGGDGNDPNSLNSSNEVTKDMGLEIPSKCYRDHGSSENRELERVRSSSVANLKRSASDCTLQKKKAFAEDNDEGGGEKVRGYPSTTRLARVHDWMKEYNVFPEKRRSVITVIGQTQTKPFSKILNEIKQRRKLAKELDRHALCEAIMESAENQSNVKNLVAKVDLVLPDGKVIYSTENVYLRSENKFRDAAAYSHQSMEGLQSGDQRKRTFQMIPEKDSSGSQLGRKNKTKRSSKKLGLPIREALKGKDNMNKAWNNLPSVFTWSVLAVICLCIAISLFYSLKPSKTYFLVSFFKPKTPAWYEKLLY